VLANVPVCATLPTSDLDRARRFYGEALGLTEGPISVGGGAFFMAGGGTMLRIYERPPGYTPAEYTVVGFLVEDLEEEMSELRDRGVTFEEYDLPRLKTENGVYTDEQRGAKGSWIRDPDGNILALTQLSSD
jgi:catechol 2,3-dioxygenase-like lactoylglutathione lyase family enzyme